MKTKYILGGLLAAGLVVAVVGGCASEKEQQAKLEAQAKISKAVAEKPRSPKCRTARSRKAKSRRKRASYLVV